MQPGELERSRHQMELLEQACRSLLDSVRRACPEEMGNASLMSKEMLKLMAVERNGFLVGLAALTVVFGAMLQTIRETELEKEVTH